MTFPAHQTLRTKLVSLSFLRLASSLAPLRNPPPPSIERNDLVSKHSTHDHHLNDPFQIFTNYAKSPHYTLKSNQLVHTHLLKTGLLFSHVFVSNSLLDWYCKSGSMDHALKLFDTLPLPNLVSWNIMISGYSRNFLFEGSFRFLGRMRVLGFEPCENTYGIILSACTVLRAPFFGEQVYSLVMKNGFFSNGYVHSGMIDLFSKSSRLEDALKVLYDVPSENVVPWNSIISGAVKSGEYWAALDLFRGMCLRSLAPNSFTLSSVLTACAALEEIEIGRSVHAWAIKCYAKDVFVGTATIDLYAKCGGVVDALKEFSRMPVRNVVSWTTIISGFVKNGDSINALNFFIEMRKMREEINNFTITSIISACSKPGMTYEAIQIHGWILKSGFYLHAVVGAALVNMYSKMGAIDSSELVFKETKTIRNPGTWVAMIFCLAQNKNLQRAIDLLKQMQLDGLRPDKFCYSSVLSIINCSNLGRQFHCYTFKIGCCFDLNVGCSLFMMYSKCGNIEDSYKVFEQTLVRDNISWASMIAGLAEHGRAGQAFRLFKDMLYEGTIPDQMILTAILTACSSLHSLQKGKEIHGYAFRAGISREVSVGGALITMYSRCGALELARKVFNMLPEKDDISCSSLVSGYAQNGLLGEALSFFHEMLMQNFMIDSFTVSSTLGAIASLNRLDIGIQLHGRITKGGLDSDPHVGSSLVTMYSKCGSIEDCHKSFQQINEPDLIAWTSMIASYAQHGKGSEALKVYEHMRNKGIRPDAVTFVGVLSACSHSGFVEEGYFYFNSMTKDFGIDPNNHHHACMVDLLGRSGELKKAEKFINSLPVKPDALVWATLLAACKLHGDIELGKLAARKVMELEPRDAGTYISLSNICASIGQWDEVLEIRNLMERFRARKEPGWSFMSKKLCHTG